MNGLTLLNNPEPYRIHDGLALYRSGQGEPTLLMPGPHRFQQSGDGSAAPLISDLTALGRQVIAFDPPGSGHSTRPVQLTLAEMHACADEALEQCGIAGPVDALGHSMGGLTLLAYAIERPARIKRLLLVGTGSGGPAMTTAPGALMNRSHPAFARMAALGIAHILWPNAALQKLMFNFIERQSYYDPSRVVADTVNPGDWLRPKWGFTHWQNVARRLDYAPRLGEITAPTLILIGRHDSQFAPACSEELAAHIPNSRIVYFERSGHYPFIEEHDAFWGTVAGFLSLQSGGAGTVPSA